MDVIHYKPHKLIFEAFCILFPTVSLIFTATKFSIQLHQKERSVKLCIHNGADVKL